VTSRRGYLPDVMAGDTEARAQLEDSSFQWPMCKDAKFYEPSRKLHW